MKPLEKGKVIGILGGGQLGMMTVEAARRLGYRSHVFAPPGGDAPACDLADDATRAGYDDMDALARFADGIDTVTTEFENVPVAVMEYLESRRGDFFAVSPGSAALGVAQHRIREKTLAREIGMAVPDFAAITKAGDIAPTLARMESGAILKTCRFGYDGKGQVAIPAGSDDVFIKTAFESLNRNDCILEARIDFIAEASFLVARDAEGEVKHFPASINTHENGILAESIAPADEDILAPGLLRLGQKFIAEMARRFNLIGVLAMEVFISRDGRLVFNEIAPRPHNSFHWTIEGAKTSQFAQFVRAIAGQPLGATDMNEGRWRMENILGDDAAMDKLRLAIEEKAQNIFIHDYRKSEARPGRKMAHITYRIK